MRETPATRLLLTLSVLLLIPAIAESRCVIELEMVWRVKPRANPTATVFQGVVQGVRRLPGGEIASLMVERVWRGRVPRQLTLYNVTGGVMAEGEELLVSTAQRLVVGTRYAIFTNPLSMAERQLFNITTPPSSTFATQGCGIFNVEKYDVTFLGKGRDPD
jgi:hypothetical protein